MENRNIAQLVAGMLFMIMGFVALAQPVTLGRTSAKSWAAGVCCSHGQSYKIELHVRVPALMFRVDSVFVGQSLFLGPKREGGTVTTTLDSLGAKVLIECARSWDYRGAQFEAAKLPAEVATTSPYEGRVKVVYHIGTQMHTLIVKEFDEWEVAAMP